MINKMNIGADSCLFVDDNPHKIASVKKYINDLNIINFSNDRHFIKKLVDEFIYSFFYH